MRRWRYRSRRSGHERIEELYLYGELDLSACVDECDSEDGEEQLRYYESRIKDSHPEWLAQDAVPIYWSVMPCYETAPFQAVYSRRGAQPMEDFLSFFTWPVDAETGDSLDWFQLPVRQDRFPALAAAIGWVPSPLQATAPMRSILNSRRAVYPDRVPSLHG